MLRPGIIWADWFIFMKIVNLFETYLQFTLDVPWMWAQKAKNSQQTSETITSKHTYEGIENRSPIYLEIRWRIPWSKSLNIFFYFDIKIEIDFILWCLLYMHYGCLRTFFVFIRPQLAPPIGRTFSLMWHIKWSSLLANVSVHLHILLNQINESPSEI